MFLSRMFLSVFILTSFILTSIALVWQSPAAAQEENAGGDPVVITVEGQSYTVSDVLEEINKVAQQFRGQLNPQQMAQKEVALFQPAVDNIINRAALQKIAEEENIEVQKDQIDQQIAQLKQNFPNEEAFNNALSQQGLSEEKLRDMLSSQLQMQVVIDAKTEDPAPPTEEEMKAFYEQNKAQMQQPEQVRASHILLKSGEEATDEEKVQVKAKLNGIAKEIEDEEITFSDAAKKYSEGPSGERGGDLNFFGKGQMVPPFEKVAFTMPVGEVSDIVETQFGYHLIKVTDKKVASTVPFEEIKPKIKEHLMQQKEQQSVQEFLQKAREDAEVEIKITEAEWKKMQSDSPVGGNKLPVPLEP